MNRGDVVWVALDPTLGSEVGKTRPAVVLQNELANRSSLTVTILPLSSKLGRIYPFQVRLEAGEGGLPKASKVMCDQVRTVARERIRGQLGSLNRDRLQAIRQALDRHLWF